MRPLAMLTLWTVALSTAVVAPACVEVRTGVGGAGGTGGVAGQAGCDPVEQTGCDPNQKCAPVLISGDPMEAETRCVPNGDKAFQEPCSFGDPGDNGFDDCSEGLTCLDGECFPICSGDPDSCLPADGFDQKCLGVEVFFEDRHSTGVCFLQCDPVRQDCTRPGQSCFLSVELAATVCSGSASDKTQDEPCEFINECAPGHGCTLKMPMSSGLFCAAFCDPSDDAGGCPALGQTCSRISRFYGNPDIDPNIGFCVDASHIPQSESLCHAFCTSVCPPEYFFLDPGPRSECLAECLDVRGESCGSEADDFVACAEAGGCVLPGNCMELEAAVVECAGP